MVIRLKTQERDKKVSDLLNIFGLPSIDYTKGYQSKPRAELTGASAASVGDPQLNAVNELFRWMKLVM